MASPIDEIFKAIFGGIPNKAGTAFEQLAAIAAHIIGGGNVKHDDKLRGEFSKTLYQLDVHHVTCNSATMGEAKDYTIRNSKVGRPDLQKLGGALPDLKNIDAGAFFSATGYTKPAKQYAEQAENITGKPITLYGLRPSTEFDEQGRIKTIVVTIHIITPQPDQATWLPHLTKNGQETLKLLLQEGEDKFEYKMELRWFYDNTGKKLLSLQKLTSYGYGDINRDTEKSNGCFCLKDHCININVIFAELHGLEYEMSYNYEMLKLRITDDSENRMVLLDKDDNILKILTDNELRKYEFDASGNLKKR